LSFLRKQESTRKMNKYFVYILASKKNGTLYIGFTDNLLRRIIEHKEKLNISFTSKYGIDKLVYYETFKYADEAIRREKNIKKWKRDWKIELIEMNNKEWKDLFFDIAEEDEILEMKKYLKEKYQKPGFLLSQE
jgi:putative endonuclease